MRFGLDLCRFDHDFLLENILLSELETECWTKSFSDRNDFTFFCSMFL